MAGPPRYGPQERIAKGLRRSPRSEGRTVLIYLDTSAFIKLYLLEKGSTGVQSLVVAQDEPLPVWTLTELELCNALRFKVFLRELADTDAERLISLYMERKRSGLYYAPYLDPTSLHETALEMTRRTPETGCRSLDILHVAAARLLDARLFATADKRQGALAEREGLTLALV